MTYAIPLTQGKFARVDDDDFALLSAFKWRYSTSGYAIRSFYVGGKEKIRSMHREIVSARPGEYVDHINGQKLLNIKANLRICTASQNLANRGLFKNSSSGFTGVTFQDGHWRAHIQIDERILFLGRFDDLKTAALVRDHAARLIYGEFARTNLPDQPIPLELRQITEQRLLAYGYSIASAELVPTL